jgi:thiamine pyrophosphate-dependent acetolactate synthase large subunit-like protein
VDIDNRIGRTIGVDFAETNFATIAEGFGCRELRVSTPSEMGSALRDAAKTKNLQSIDVLMSKEEPFFKCLV